MTGTLLAWMAAAVAVSLWGEGSNRPRLRAAGKLAAREVAMHDVLGSLEVVTGGQHPRELYDARFRAG